MTLRGTFDPAWLAGIRPRQRASGIEALLWRAAAARVPMQSMYHAEAPSTHHGSMVLLILFLRLLLVSALLALFVVCGLVGPSTHMRVRHL